MDTGAGCTIGNLNHFAGEVLTNPSILVEVFTCKDGKYAPLTMHGIVDPDAEGGNHTSELPVAFRLRTAYKLRGGKDLHLMIGLCRKGCFCEVRPRKPVVETHWSSGRVLYPDMKKFPLV